MGFCLLTNLLFIKSCRSGFFDAPSGAITPMNEVLNKVSPHTADNPQTTLESGTGHLPVTYVMYVCIRSYRQQVLTK